MNIVFMGTPEFAVKSLEALIDAGHNIVAVVTQPDKPKGRGKALAFSPVKEFALAQENCEIEIFQPERIKRPEAVEILKKYNADIFVVAAFGQILSKEILEMPPYGCINVHASLLPKYRGAAPIQQSILDGESVTGVTIMQMNEGLDTGDMISSVEVKIEKNDTGDSLHDKLALAGAELLIETLTCIENKKIKPQKQNDSESSYARMLKKEMGHIDWSKSAAEIDRIIRALNSWPCAYSEIMGKTIKIWEAMPMRTDELPAKNQTADNTGLHSHKYGEVCMTDKNHIYVMTGDGIIRLDSIQLQGKKRMPVKDFLLGFKINQGDRFGMEQE